MSDAGETAIKRQVMAEMRFQRDKQQAESSLPAPSGVELAKKLVSELTPEERAAPINKLTTVNQVVAVAACFTAMMEAVATHYGKPDNAELTGSSPVL